MEPTKEFTISTDLTLVASFLIDRNRVTDKKNQQEALGILQANGYGKYGFNDFDEETYIAEDDENNWAEKELQTHPTFMSEEELSSFDHSTYSDPKGRHRKAKDALVAAGWLYVLYDQFQNGKNAATVEALSESGLDFSLL